MTSLDHVSFATADLAVSRAFYEAALKPLGMKIILDYGDVLGMGGDFPFFWFGKGGALAGRLHVAFRADNRAAVDTFYIAALAAGGKDNGPPGLRAHYHPAYYGAFVLDPDGHNIEAVCHAPE